MTDRLGGVLGARNPLRMPSRAVRQHHYGAGYRTVSMSSATTTDTTVYYVRSFVIVQTVSRKAKLFVATHHTMKHSAANAQVDVAVRLFADATTGTTLYTDRMNFFCLPTADTWFGVDFMAAIPLGVADARPGPHRVNVMVGLDTAGTLSMGEPDSTDEFAIFELGYAS